MMMMMMTLIKNIRIFLLCFFLLIGKSILVMAINTKSLDYVAEKLWEMVITLAKRQATKSKLRKTNKRS